MPEIALRKHVAGSFDAVEATLRAALAAEGFGGLTEIDVQATLRAKLDVNFRRYKILGACNPPLAHQALLADERVGVLLPCNVVLSEPPGGGTTVYAFDPAVMMAMADLPALDALAQDARARLERVLASL